MTEQDVKDWLKRNGKTQIWLAKQVMMTPKGLNNALKNNLHERLVANIERVMAEHDKQVRAKLHPEVRVKVEAWAEMMHKQIDEVTQLVIAHTLGMDISTMSQFKQGEQAAPSTRKYGENSLDDMG